MGMRSIRQLNSVVIHCAVVATTWGTMLSQGTNLAAAKPPSASNASATSPGSSDSTETNSSGSSPASVEPSTPAEKRAAKLAKEATGADFRSGRHAVAEKKLREAIQICLMQKCSVPFQARLHRDLGIVYVAGMKRVEDGKDEFTAALTADATVILPDSMDTAAVKEAFADVKASMASEPSSTAAADSSASAADAKPEPESNPSKAKHASHPDGEASQDIAEPPEAKTCGRAFLNWFSLGLEQDIIFHSSTLNACSTGSRYQCFDRQGQLVPVDNFVPGGNQVSGGVTSGTWRILVGYDRVFARQVFAGLAPGFGHCRQG